jgi:hypothetical protein
MPDKKTPPVNDPREEWWGIFKHRDLTAKQKITVHFATDEDREAFARLVDQPLTERTRSIWFPPTEIRRYGICR